MPETFTEEELKSAASSYTPANFLDIALDAAKKDYFVKHRTFPASWTREELEQAAKKTGWWQIMEALLKDVVTTRETLTWDELERYYASCGYGANHLRDVKRKIIEAREPKYPLNTVVKDANGAWYRKYSDGWGVFGRSQTVPFDTPVRPLQVQS